jgi:hypothetical protein
MTTTTTTPTTSKPATEAFPPGPRTLDDLAALDVDALTALYRAGRMPASMAALDGNPRCRMLSIRGLDRGGVAGALRRFAASSSFPWAGKSFSSEAPDRGRGINRVRLGGERRWFPFVTLVEPSAIDGQPCIFLDYRQPENPRAIQMIRDELREVAPGLFLGPAMLDTGRSPAKLVLWFAVHAQPAN